MGNDTTAAIGSLDTLESVFDADWFDDEFDTLETTEIESTRQIVSGSDGLPGYDTQDVEEEPKPEISLDVVDKILPAVGIGAGELIKYAFKKGPSFPVGWSQKMRKLGTKGVAYTMALDAYSLTKDTFESYNVRPGFAMAGSAVAGGTAYKGSQALFRLSINMANNIKVGMASTAVERVMREASEEVYKEIMEKGGKMASRSAAAQASARLFATDAAEEASKRVFTVIKQRLGEEGAKHLDDVTRQLLKPTIAMKVGKFLGKRAPSLAAKLTVSAGAFAVPEPVSSVLGAAGMIWTAYDVFNLMQEMPDLYNIIFEEPKPVGSDEGAYFTTPSEPSIEDQIIRDMVEMEKVFPYDQHPVNTSRKQ